MKLAVDENFDGRALRGLLLRNPGLDVVRVQDVGLGGVADPEILAWAASEGRVLLSHDVATMIGFAAERLRAGEPMAGLVIVPQTASVGLVIDALLQLLHEHRDQGFQGLVTFLQF